MKIIRILLPILILAAAVGILVVLQVFQPKPQPQAIEVNPPTVEVTTAQPAPATLHVTTQGSARPRTTTQLVPQVGGRIIELAPAFIEGGVFEKDTPLVRLDPLDYELALSEARQRAAQAALLLAEEKARADQAARDWVELGRGGDPPPLVLRKPQLAQASAAVQAAEAAVATASRDLERTTLPAPYHGRVLEKRVETGEFAAKGAVLGRIYSDALMEVPLPLGQADLAKLGITFQARGQFAAPLEVDLTAAFGADTVTWRGRIHRSDAAFDEKTRTLNLIAEVTPEDGDLPLLPGQFVTATITGRTLPEAILLPRSAMRGFDRVLVVTPEDRLAFREVTATTFDQDHVVVTDGLQAGERVCLTPLQTVIEGMRVRVTNQEEAGQPKP